MGRGLGTAETNLVAGFSWQGSHGRVPMAGFSWQGSHGPGGDAMQCAIAVTDRIFAIV